MNKYLKPNLCFKYSVRFIYKVCSPLVSFVERIRVNKKSRPKLVEYPPIFIVGAPRTGSTVLYQSITNQADVLYIDNLVCLFFSNFLFGFWLSNSIFKQKAHNCFQSEYGDTSNYGWHAPSECGSFWYRWLPANRHFVDHNEIAIEDIEEIKVEIAETSNYFKKSIIFKNLNAGQRLRMLVKAFPDAKFIFVRRDPLYTAQSIIKAKRKLKIPGNQFWSIMPPNVDELKKLDWHEQIVKQIYYIEKQIAEDLQLFPKQNVYEVNYTELTQEKITELIAQIDLKKKTMFQAPEIILNEKLSLPEQEIQLIQNEIKKLDWSQTHVK